MTYDFFRKERPEVFEERFTAPTPPLRAWGMRSQLIFEAKAANKVKKFKVTANGKEMALEATVMGCEVLVRNQANSNTPATLLRLSEANMADALESRIETSVIYQVAKKLCKDHATSSASSPLISGCIENNFGANSTYDGYKLQLTLRHRQPFMNPFVSGLEKEYFLIGQVLDTDCVTMTFLGQKNIKTNQLINFYGSKLSRPNLVTPPIVLPDMTGSRLQPPKSYK